MEQTMTDAEQLAHRLCALDRSDGGGNATNDILDIAREFNPIFRKHGLFYKNGKSGPSAIAAGCDPAYANIIITAHYDTLGFAGGCDNTSGVVAVLLASTAMSTDANLYNDVCLMLLPREEPPFFGSGTMGSQALRESMEEEPWLFVAVDTIGGCKNMGARKLEICGAADALPNDWARDMVVCKRTLHNLCDARNFPNSGVLLTDERVLNVPMHTRKDTVEAVDWDFVLFTSQKLRELIS